MRALGRIGWVAATTLAVASLAIGAGPASHVDRVTLADALDSDYLQLPIPPEVRVHPDAETRLLVLRDGGIILDLGLRDRHDITGPETRDGRTIVEEHGLLDEAHIAHDGRNAILVSTEFVLQRFTDDVDGGVATSDRLVRSDVSLTWLDADHPGGRWRMSLDRGRLVALVYVFAGGRGVMVMITGGEDGRPELMVLGPDRQKIAHLEELSSLRPTIDPTPSDFFLAADVGFSPRPGKPDRALLVLDMLRGYHWVYEWEYGSEAEPLSWDLEDTGVLLVHVPGKTLRYDRLGRLVGER